MMTRTYSICRRSHSDPATISKTTGNVRVQNAIVRSRDARRWAAESGDRSWNSRVSRACIKASSSHRTVVAGHIYDRCGQSNVTMDEHEWLAKRFEEHRTHLRAVAYRMLGSLAEADDAVQDAWLRVSRSGANGVENFGGWLTTIVARVCLNA